MRSKRKDSIYHLRKRMWKTTRKHLPDSKTLQVINRVVRRPFKPKLINYRFIYLINAYSQDTKYKERVRGHDFYSGLLPTQDERDLYRDVMEWEDGEYKSRVLLFLEKQAPNIEKEIE